MLFPKYQSLNGHRVRVWGWWKEWRVMEEQKRIYRRNLRGFSFQGSVIILLVLGASWSGMAWLAVGAVENHKKIELLELELSHYRTETVVEHNVTVLRKLDDGDYAFQSDEEPDGGTFRICDADCRNGLDVDAVLVHAIGVTADHAAWDERGVCKSILRSDLGFWWRDKHNDFKFTRTKGY